MIHKSMNQSCFLTAEQTSPYFNWESNPIPLTFKCKTITKQTKLSDPQYKVQFHQKLSYLAGVSLSRGRDDCGKILVNYPTSNHQ